MKLKSEIEENITFLGRRAFLQGTFASVAGVVISGLLSGCSDASPSPSSTILLSTPIPVNGQPEQTTPAQAIPTSATTNNTPTKTQTTLASSNTTPAQPG